MNPDFYEEIPSDLKCVKKAVMTAMDYLSVTFPGMAHSDYYDLKLMISELMVNAVCHGNQNSPFKKVSLALYCYSPQEIVGIVTDEGDGFDYTALLESIHDISAVFLEHGRGISIVSTLADELTFLHAGSQIKFKKKVHLLGENTNCR